MIKRFLTLVAVVAMTGSLSAQVDCINNYLDCDTITESPGDTLRLLIDAGIPGDTAWVYCHFIIPEDTVSGFFTVMQYDRDYLTPATIEPDPGHPEDSVYIVFELLGPLADLQADYPDFGLTWFQVSEDPADSGAVIGAFINQPPDTILTILAINEPLFRIAFILNPAMPAGATTGVWFYEVNDQILVSEDPDQYFCIDCRRSNLSVEMGQISGLLNPTTVGADYTNAAPCCDGIRGNVDGDIEESIDISDVVYLVNYMFLDGPAPCVEEADINADGFIEIADLVSLINYMFNDGVAPQPCP